MRKPPRSRIFFALVLIALLSVSGGCLQRTVKKELPVKKPIVTGLYIADPSAHVFEDRLYLYPSHDIDTGVRDSNDGAQFDMKDYHVFSFGNMDEPPTDHDVALALEDVPWAARQLWAPDAAYRNGTYYFYFPAKDRDGIFRIGVAVSDSPAGPFTARPEPIPGSYSIDPAVFTDEDGEAYMYFGGLWGGQLERWRSGSYDPAGTEPDAHEPALGPMVAKLSADMLSFDGPVRSVSILDEQGKPLSAGDNARRFFEGAWVHMYNGTYYLSYSTGDTHYLVYATADNPYGPFTYRGRLLNPVVGWTTHHSIVEYRGTWYLFYHDSSLSGGRTHLRSVKFTDFTYNPDGSIGTIEP